MFEIMNWWLIPIILILILFTELFLKFFWIPFYYNSGIPIYVKNFNNISLMKLKKFNIDSELKSLTTDFYVKENQTMAFKIMDKKNIAFRNAFVLWRWSLSLNRFFDCSGIISFDKENKVIRITAHPSYSTLLFILLFVFLPIFSSESKFFLIIWFSIILVLILLYIYINYIFLKNIANYIELRYKNNKNK